MVRAWQEKCASCRRRRKAYAHQGLTFYCRSCWNQRDEEGSTNLFIGNTQTRSGFTGPVWRWDARPNFVVLQQ